MEEMDDLLEIQKVTGIQIPVKSGTPWKKHETKREKDKIKEKKLLNQMGARRKVSKTVGGDSKRQGSNISSRKQTKSIQGSTIRAGDGRPRSKAGDGRGERRTDQERRDSFARVIARQERLEK
jgi:hypothetical protein